MSAYKLTRKTVGTNRLLWAIFLTLAVVTVVAPVQATIDQQAHGRSVGEIEKQTANGTTRYAVALGSRDQNQELLIDEGGRVIATDAGEDDD